jgi:hypothetical protein
MKEALLIGAAGSTSQNLDMATIPVARLAFGIHHTHKNAKKYTWA